MAEQADERVRAAFNALPEEYRSVLGLALEGHGYAEVADRLGVAPATVRRWGLQAVQTLTRARRTVAG